MRRMLGLLLLLASCAVPSKQAVVGGIPVEESFEAAYARVRSGARDSARAGGWMIERAGPAIRILREQPVNLDGRVPDVAITHRLRRALPRAVEVRTEAGVVTLRGFVDTQWAAVHAIQAAMRERGVTAVESELSFPINQAHAP